MRGMKANNLMAIMDFLYVGEANVFQEDLGAFLAIAEELKLKGLMGNSEERFGDSNKDEKYLPGQSLPNVSTERVKQKISSNVQKHSKLGANGTSASDSSLAIPGNFSVDFGELDERVKSLMEKSQNRTANGLCFADRCKACGKEGYGRNIKDHIEANHLEGVVIPCSLCDKTFRSRDSIRHHRRKQHKN